MHNHKQKQKHCYGDSSSDDDDIDRKVFCSIELRNLAIEQILLKRAVAECNAAGAKTADAAKAAGAKTADASKDRKLVYTSGLYFALSFICDSDSE